MLTLAEARQRILERVPLLPPESIRASEAAGRISAESILAPIDLPPFDTSAVDGYAVRSLDVAGATLESPVELQIISTVAAGEQAGTSVRTRTCERIFTGAMIPPDADAVVMQEDTLPSPDDARNVRMTCDAKPWENIRFHGEDVKAGTTVVHAGTRLNFGHVALLSALGVAEIRVSRRPVVAILATGTELTLPGEPLSPGKIYESNRATLATLVERCGGVPRLLPLAPDDRAATRQAMRDAFRDADVVVTVGGVSVGDLDLVRPVFTELGGVIDFWRIAVRPGKPFVFGLWQNKVLFGLPGNPVSAAVCFWLLGRPGLFKIQGAVSGGTNNTRALLGESLHNKGDRPHFVRVTVREDGRLYNTGTQASHILSSLANSDGLVEVPAATNLPASTEVPFVRWDQP